MKKQPFNIMKSSFAVLVAGSITLSGTAAFANSNDDNIDTVKLEQQANQEVSVNDEAVMDSAKEELENLKDSAEAPSLLPGDFFYFAKLAIEKIQLAFTMDDSKEAKLLAEYASERLAEAEALFADGKQEEALEALNKAVDMMDEYEAQWSGSDDKENDAEPGDEEASSEADQEDDSSKEDEASEGETPSDADETDASHEGDKVDELMAQNISSLKANVEKVKNPKAKAALLKNIEKSYVKLAEKLAKLEAKASKKDAETEDVEKSEPQTQEGAEKEESTEKPDESQPSTPAQPEEVKAEEVKEDHAPAPAKEAHHEKKEAKKEWKASHEEMKQEMKKVHRNVKKEEKEHRHEWKQESKQKRHELKEEKKHHEAKDHQERQRHNEKRDEGGKGKHKE